MSFEYDGFGARGAADRSLNVTTELALLEEGVSSLDVLPEMTFLFLGGPYAGHCDTDLLRALAGGAGSRRILGRAVAFGLEEDYFLLD